MYTDYYGDNSLYEKVPGISDCNQSMPTRRERFDPDIYRSEDTRINFAVEDALQQHNASPDIMNKFRGWTQFLESKKTDFRNAIHAPFVQRDTLTARFKADLGEVCDGVLSDDKERARRAMTTLARYESPEPGDIIPMTSSTEKKPQPADKEAA